MRFISDLLNSDYILAGTSVHRCVPGTDFQKRILITQQAQRARSGRIPLDYPRDVAYTPMKLFARRAHCEHLTYCLTCNIVGGLTGTPFPALITWTVGLSSSAIWHQRRRLSKGWTR
jgi:hypothetical protein